MIINERLKKVSDLVDSDVSILDIGCDHALLDIYLAKRKDKKCKKIVASDNKEGPLEQASKNILAYQLQDKIELRLGDGLDIYTSDIDTVIISGMGGKNMIRILRNNLKSLKTIKTFILSPNNYQSEVKRFLVRKKYIIQEEYLVKEGKIIYQILKFVKGKRRYTKKEYFLGPVLITHKDNVFREYYLRELKTREILLTMLPKKYHLKRRKIAREIKFLKEELE